MTNKKNKCPLLSEILEVDKGSKIIALTETWGFRKVAKKEENESEKEDNRRRRR